MNLNRPEEGTQMTVKTMTASDFADENFDPRAGADPKEEDAGEALDLSFGLDETSNNIDKAGYGDNLDVEDKK